MKYTKAEVAEQKANLLNWLKPGDTVYTIIESVSRSGMQRQIRVVFPVVKDGEFSHFIHPNYAVSRVLGRSQAKTGNGDGVICKGCGMDMGFDLVYQLSHLLFGDGYALRHSWI
jgi:hypothetical protein